MWRIKYSRPFNSKKPPLVLAENPRSAPSISSKVTPRCAIFAVSGATRYWRTSPPIGITCATPGIVSKRGRSTKSAYSRTAIDELRSLFTGRAINMISPMMDEIGPMVGLTPCGICSRTNDNLSATDWRARYKSVPQLKVT